MNPVGWDMSRRWISFDYSVRLFRWLKIREGLLICKIQGPFIWGGVDSL
jgi:hypothetical protein